MQVQITWHSTSCSRREQLRLLFRSQVFEHPGVDPAWEHFVSFDDELVVDDGHGDDNDGDDDGDDDRLPGELSRWVGLVGERRTTWSISILKQQLW